MQTIMAHPGTCGRHLAKCLKARCRSVPKLYMIVTAAVCLLVIALYSLRSRSHSPLSQDRSTYSAATSHDVLPAQQRLMERPVKNFPNFSQSKVRKPGPVFERSVARSSVQLRAAGARDVKQGSRHRHQSAEVYNPASMLYKLLNSSQPYDGGYNVPDYRQVLPRYMYEKHGREKSQAPLTIFVIPHSHNDPGWLETFEDYYTRSTSDALNNIVQGLKEYPDWKFIWSETSFLKRWWKDADESSRAMFQEVVKEGRLDLTSGGWVMPDEANTHYYAVLDQLIEGHDWIRSNIDPGWHPRSSWSNDPFGYSSSVAHLYHLAGIRHMMILRIHYMVKRQLAQNRALQFYWKQPWDSTGVSSIFTHLEPSGLYSTKHSCGPSEEACCNFDFFYLEFCRGTGSCDCSVQKITQENIHWQAQNLLEQARAKAQLFRVNTVAILNGDDFRYNTRAEVVNQYENFRALMEYINSHAELRATVKFGTLADFLHSMNRTEPAVDFPMLSGDFFPYSDKGEAYWTGYFSSRPHHKRIARRLQSVLYAADVLHTLMHARHLDGASESQLEQLTLARTDFNLFQHHDAVTGTSRTYVMQDYLDRLLVSFRSLTQLISVSLSHLSKVPSLHSVAAVDKASSDVGEMVLDIRSGQRTLLVFNPLPREARRMVTFISNTAHVVMFACVPGKELDWQVYSIEDGQQNTSATSNLHHVVFNAQLPALGYALFRVHANKTKSRISRPTTNHNAAQKDVQKAGMSNTLEKKPVRKHFTLTMNNASASFSSDGLLSSVTVAGRTVRIRVQFALYREDLVDGQSGGAYIFQPKSQAQRLSDRPSVRVVRGCTCHIVISFWRFFNHTVKLCKLPNVKPSRHTEQHPVQISIENSVNMNMVSPDADLAMRITSSVRSRDIFFTDLNSLQLARRQRFPGRISSNFYPMTSLAFIEDKDWRISLHTAQPLGVASLRSGSLEVILDRYTTSDDGRGPVGGTPDCHARSVSKFELLLERKSSGSGTLPGMPSMHSHLLSERLLHPVQLYASSTPHHVGSTSAKLVCQQSLLQHSLPCDLQLVSLRRLSAKKASLPRNILILHRIEHNKDQTNAPVHCAKLSDSPVHLANLFSELKVTKAVNSSLTGLQEYAKIDPRSDLLLSPRDLKTFLVRLQTQT